MYNVIDSDGYPLFAAFSTYAAAEAYRDCHIPLGEIVVIFVDPAPRPRPGIPEGCHTWRVTETREEGRRAYRWPDSGREPTADGATDHIKFIYARTAEEALRQ